MWIKPSEMPKDFWGHAWIVWRSRWSKSSEPSKESVTPIQNKYRKYAECGAYYNEGSEDWESMNDQEFRVWIITEPEYKEGMFDE